MAYPAGVQTVTLRLGSSFDSAGTLASITGYVAPMMGAGADHLVWSATGQTYAKVKTALSWDDTEKVALAIVPHPTQAGWRDQTQATFAGWSYQITAVARYASGEPQTFERIVTPQPGDTVIDVDLLPNGVAATPAVLAEWEQARLDVLDAIANAGGGGGSSSVTADDTPAAPAEGGSASYLVTSAVTWPAGLVWSTDPDGGVTPTITGTALVSMFTLGGVTRAILGATFPGVVAPDATAPSTVTGLTATATGPTTVNLAWSAATDNVGVTGYEYRIGGGAAVDAGAGTAETVTGLTAGTLYSFEVRAYDAAGNRSASWSTAATATTTAPDTTPPVWTATLTPGTPTETSVVVTASALATDANTITYERTLDSTAGTPVWAAIVPSGLNFTLDGLAAGTVYANCALRAKDAAGNLSTVLAVPSFTTAGAAASLEDTILALSPVGYWKLDETSGTTATDSSGNGHHGTHSGSVSPAAAGAVYTGGKTTIPDHNDLSITGAITVFAIAKPTTLAAGFVAAKAGANAFEWGLLCLGTGGIVKAVAWTPTGNEVTRATSVSGLLTAGTWTGLCAAIPSTSAGTVALWADSGSPRPVNGGGSGTYEAGSGVLNIGSRGDGLAWDGEIRHVAIFAGTLNDTQVGVLMTAARAEGLIP